METINKKKFKNNYNILENIDIYYDKCDNIDLIVNKLKVKLKDIMNFFSIKKLEKKTIIYLWDNKDDLDEKIKLLTKIDEVPFWAVGNAWNEKESDICRIDNLILEKQIKIDYHKNKTLDDFIKGIVHEFVHICHFQFCNYHYPQELWITEGVATYLSNQYENSELTCTISEILSNDTVEYNNYRYIFNKIVDKFAKKDIDKILNSELSIDLNDILNN